MTKEDFIKSILCYLAKEENNFIKLEINVDKVKKSVKISKTVYE